MPTAGLQGREQTRDLCNNEKQRTAVEYFYAYQSIDCWETVYQNTEGIVSERIAVKPEQDSYLTQSCADYSPPLSLSLSTSSCAFVPWPLHA